MSPTKFRSLPPDVFPLVACVAAGLTFLGYSAARTLFYSGEVQYATLYLQRPPSNDSLYNDTRQDELLENPIVLEKGISYSRNSWYGKLAKKFDWDSPTFYDPAWTKPDQTHE